MEDSFRVRVDKTFGSLASSSSSPHSSLPLSSLWCLTDEEIERREWNRERGSPDNTEPKPYPPNLDGFWANQPMLSSQTEPLVYPEELEADLQDLSDYNDDDNDDEDEEDEEKQRRRGSSSGRLVKPDDHDGEEWDIRSSIGLDCTLDNEEEEDGHDKLAVCKEKADDHLYMRDVAGYWTDINFYDELPNSFEDVTRDPRANHLAANLRLQEDAEAAGKFDSLQVSNTGSCVPKTDVKALVEVVNLKSIMKRKEKEGDLKLQKRVQFEPGCDNECEEECEGTKDVMDSCSTEDGKMTEESLIPQEWSAVPDYIRNPSKYTHYAFDSSSDSDEESNQKAYMNFVNQLKISRSIETEPVDISVDLPKSVTFTKKSKPGDASTVKRRSEIEQNPERVGKELMPKKGWPICIAAEEVEESEVCAMEEDEPERLETKNSGLGKQGRQYRTKGNNIELDELVT